MRKKILLVAVLALLAVPGFGVSQCETKLHACSNRCETTTTTDQQYEACLDRCDAAYDACSSYAPPNDCPVYICPPYG